MEGRGAERKPEIKVSIVMPVLNTAAYIRECMESLVHQTLQEIEIICVDACSTDGTREILEEYAAEDARVHVLDDTKGSTGYANNLGMQTARGAYLAIAEPDDFVAQDMYEKLYQAAIENQADVVRADYRIFFGDQENREWIDKAIASKDAYGRAHCPARQQELFQFDMSTWAGIFARELFETGLVCHNETPGAAYQDNGFWFLLMAHAKRLYYLPVSGYRYRMDNPGSSVHNRNRLFAICDEYDFIRKRLEQEGIFECFEDTYVWVKFIRYLSAYYRLDDTFKPAFAGRFAEEMQEHMHRREQKQEAQEGGKDKGREAIGFSKGQQKLLKELLQGGSVFHANRMEEKARFHELAGSDRQLILYGCGSDGIRLLNYSRGVHCLDRIAALCDSNPRLWGSELFGKRVMGPEEAGTCFAGAAYLVASINYGDEIRKMLSERGIRQEDICEVNFC